MGKLKIRFYEISRSLLRKYIQVISFFDWLTFYVAGSIFNMFNIVILRGQGL